MSFYTIGKTTVNPNISSSIYRGSFHIANQYLDTDWHNINDKIWDRLSARIALMVEQEIIKEMKTKMNKESYEKIFIKELGFERK